MSEEDKVVNLVQSTPDTSSVLATIDHLRAKVAAGEIVCFAAVGIDATDGTFMWIGQSGRKSQLQLLGAMENLKLHFWIGSIK